MSAYYTDPTNPPKDKRQLTVIWDHKIDTTNELIKLGVPLRSAELASIDFTYHLTLCQKNQLTPEQSARMLLDIIKPAYTREDGSWRFV